MYRFSLLVLAAAALGACAKEPVSTAELSRHGPHGIAIGGYSPVSYFTNGTAEKGSPEFTAAHDGLTYWFTDASQASQFRTDPEKYVPAHRGWCSLMLTGSGNLAVASPESFKIVDDRLLLFWSGDFKGQPIDGSRNWESKFDDGEGERKLLAKADRTWNGLLAGSRAENVVFFNDRDLQRVNAARREAGRKMFE